MTALHWMSVGDLALAIRQGRLSPVQLVEALLDRIVRMDPLLHAFVSYDRENALASARAAEVEIASGRYRGPLHGIPVGIKDVIDVRGVATTCHSKLRSGHMADADAAVVVQLREAGAVILGKLATHEFALGGPCFDLPFPPARNPWNMDHHPGGSSSGGGAALAAGLLPLAVGTDTAGSIRNPASACGVVGLKPTYGLVSRAGIFPLAATLDHVGPMARSVDDVRLLLQVIARRGQRGQPEYHAVNAEEPGAMDARRTLQGLHIGFVRHFHERDVSADVEVAAALESVATTLAQSGATVRSVELPDLKRFAAVSRILLQTEGWATHSGWLRERPQDYGSSTRRRLLPGAFLTAEDYVKSQRHRATLIEALQAVFREVDVLLCANAMEPPCRLDDQPMLEKTYPRQARTPFNVTGHPAIAMMAGLSREGLPLSVQFAGRYFEEMKLLRVAEAWEEIGGWRDRHPPDFDRRDGQSEDLEMPSAGRLARGGLLGRF
jgi:aspartyl-tRNA(Asn)/glutamyl-tRNA(Gln) amidotransferase subunit A